ncbi:MAG TPA: SDR family NAD(P)-dependent oxidoreductase, partial [Verrucomicrobiae bacterium]|nr:SDR family NAD(P)-dependent oxidoreductase [Verrucomicrobiae bacterium]
MNQIDLKKRVAIVTGSARGIGLAIARRLKESGANVALWDVDADAASAAAKELGARAIQVDVTSIDSVAQAAEATVQAFGKIDILVNNAGIAGANAKLWETDPAEWQRVININLHGPFHCCRAVVPHLLQNNYGRIVNIASIAGKEGNPNAAHYSASKAGLIAITKSLGKELATRNILVNCIAPAVIETD